MFTGIVTDVGRLSRVADGDDGRLLRVATTYDVEAMPLGASVACDGVCLTVTAHGLDEAGGWFEVFAGVETMAVTNVATWTEGRRINLERALRVGDELGGHMVLGHVDGTAILTERTETSEQVTLTFEMPASVAPFVAKKGSISLNGTSLTVNAVTGNRFSVHLIPHTVAVTAWGDYAVGERLNIEVDPMARYAARLLETVGGLRT
ncbi:MAG TPA: riboflavin synthase [Reyranella sp.]|nr:riboflavin synthase [Reyranella sp.]